MALKYGDRVLETSTTTGTGALTLAAAVTGYQRFSAICSTNDTLYYSIFAVDANGNPTGDWETGLGTYSAANTLTRTTVKASSNSGSAVSFAAGTKYVMLTPISFLFGLLLRSDNNLSDVASASAARTNLGLAIGSDVQAYSANLAALASAGGIKQGTHTIPVPAGAMTARTTNGAASGTTESTTNKVMTRTLDYDASTAEYAQVSIPMPKSWNEGTVTVQFIWTATNTGDVVWAAQAQYQRDDDAIDGSWGTAQSVTDSVTAAGDRMISGFTSAITPAGTGGDECSLLIQCYRDAANGSDTCTVDAKLIGIRVKYTINAGDDS